MKFSLKKIDFKKFGTFRIELLILFLGGILLVMPNLFFQQGKNDPGSVVKNETNSAAKIKDDNNSYAEEESEKLRVFLEGIKGVGSVDVLIYVDTDVKTVHASENDSQKENTEESDSNGGKRVNSKLDEKTVYKVVRDSDGNECLVPLYNQFPDIKGVLISAEGADNNIVKADIIEAVSRLYDIPVHKISVLKKIAEK